MAVRTSATNKPATLEGASDYFFMQTAPCHGRLFVCLNARQPARKTGGPGAEWTGELRGVVFPPASDGWPAWLAAITCYATAVIGSHIRISTGSLTLDVHLCLSPGARRRPACCGAAEGTGSRTYYNQ